MPEHHTFHHSTGSPFIRVEYKMSMRRPVCTSTRSYLDCWMKCNKDWFSWSQAWWGRYYVSTWAKSKSSYSCCNLMYQCTWWLSGLDKKLCDCCYRSVHSDILDTLSPKPTLNCKRCTGLSSQTSRWYTNDRGNNGKDKPEVMPSFAPKRMLIHRWRLWTIFHQCMPCWIGRIQRAPLRHQPHSHPITSRDWVYTSCIRNAMLNASKTWAQTTSWQGPNITGFNSI